MFEIPDEEPDVGGIAGHHPIRQITEQVPGQIERKEQRNQPEHNVRTCLRLTGRASRIRVAGPESTGAGLACGSGTAT